jgi:hypothetical protein
MQFSGFYNALYALRYSHACCNCAGVMSIFFLYYSQGPKSISALTAIDVQKQNSLSEQASETFEDFVGQFPSVITHATQNCQEQIWQVRPGGLWPS